MARPAVQSAVKALVVAAASMSRTSVAVLALHRLAWCLAASLAVAASAAGDPTPNPTLTGLCTASYTGAANNGLWNDANNWFPADVPGAADNACLRKAGFYSVAVIGNVSVHDVDIGDGDGSTRRARTCDRDR